MGNLKQEHYDEMTKEIINILTTLDYHNCFLLGDNGCGKTDITEKVIPKDKTITIFDNYMGTYKDLPKTGKNIIITYDKTILYNANSTDTVILICDDGLYCVTDIEDYGHTDNLFQKLFMNEISRTFTLQRLLSNAVSGVWSDYIQKYLDEYKKGEISKCNQLILDEIQKLISKRA